MPPPNSHVHNIALLLGDGQGPQLARHAKQILNQIQHTRKDISFHVSEHEFGGAALAAGADTALPPSTLQACRASDALIVCGCGDLRYGIEPEKGLLSLLQELSGYANIRPVRFPSSQLAQQSAYKPVKVEDLDITFFRDLTSGMYYGPRKEADNDGQAYDTTAYSRNTIERLARLADTYAMRFSPPKPVHSVDKYNVMATSRLGRSVVSEVFEKEFPHVPLGHFLVDTTAMMLSSNPLSLNGIILTENMFGDILSDQAGGILPSPDMLASAAVSRISSTGSKGDPGIFEPFNLKGKGLLANPLGIVQAVHLMLDTFLGLSAEAEALEMAIRRTLDPVELVGSDVRTVDLGGSSTADEFMETLLHHLDYYLEAANSVDLSAIPATV